MSVWVEIIGCVAGALSSGSYVPQLVKLVHQKQVQGVSVQTYVCGFFGGVVWIIYGIINHSISLVLFNAFNMVVSAIILYLLNKYRSKSFQNGAGLDGMGPKPLI
jgi:MtN3 and saliva related transmembrane protein